MRIPSSFPLRTREQLVSLYPPLLKRIESQARKMDKTLRCFERTGGVYFEAIPALISSRFDTRIYRGARAQAERKRFPLFPAALLFIAGRCSSNGTRPNNGCEGNSLSRANLFHEASCTDLYTLRMICTKRLSQHLPRSSWKTVVLLWRGAAPIVRETSWLVGLEGSSLRRKCWKWNWRRGVKRWLDRSWLLRRRKIGFGRVSGDFIRLDTIGNYWGFILLYTCVDLSMEMMYSNVVANRWLKVMSKRGAQETFHVWFLAQREKSSTFH